jgi:sugar (pentulose or hexulose) kinase
VYLIVNLGLKSIRVIVFNNEGKTLYSDSIPVHTSLKGEKVEQDVDEWKNSLFRLLGDLAEKTDLVPKIDFITSTTSSSCVFGYDKNMNPITKVLMVSDKRSSNEVSFIRANSMYIKENSKNSVYCSESSNVPKLLWFRNNFMDVFKNIRHWVGANEFLNYEFTGELVTDSLNASKSFYSSTHNEYLKDILENLSISSNLFPEVRELGAMFALSDSMIKAFPFSKKCRYVITTYDAICAVIGSLSGDSGDVCDVSGTVTSVRALAQRDIKIKDSDSVILRQDIPLIQHTLIGSSNNLGGGIVEWYRQAFFHNTTHEGYTEIENEALKSPPGANGLIFLPFLLGERSPFTDKDIRGSFFGINRESKRQDFTKAVFESTAYVTNDLIELIRNENFEIKSLSVSGGLARFDLINQIKADVTNLPVKVIGNFESTSLGALILLKVSLGHYSSVYDAAKDLVTIRKVIYPNENNVQIYSDSFSLYKELISLTRSIGSSHSKFLKRTSRFTSTTISNL